jgi:copper(I)-binding protein
MSVCGTHVLQKGQRLLTLCVFLSLTTPLFAQDITPIAPREDVPELDAQAKVEGKNAFLLHGTNCVSMALLNKGKIIDALVAAKTSVADGAVLIDQRMHRDVEKIEMLPNVPLTIAAGNACIILRDVKTELAAGDTFTMTLFFAKADPINVNVHVTAEAKTETEIKP